MARKPRKGAFIVFEGIDGAGTTTQTQMTAEWLRERGERVHVTREPSDGPIGMLIRQVLRGRLVSRDAAAGPRPMDPATIALLFAADRLDHLDNEVRPQLEAGYHVISDRYVMSSLAYQSVEVDARFVRQVNEKAITPDVTFFLSIPAEVAMARIGASRADRDTFENLPFQRQVADRYEQLASAWRDGRLVRIDGELNVSSVCKLVRTEIDGLL